MPKNKKLMAFIFYEQLCYEKVSFAKTRLFQLNKPNGYEILLINKKQRAVGGFNSTKDATFDLTVRQHEQIKTERKRTAASKSKLKHTSCSGRDNKKAVKHRTNNDLHPKRG